MQGHKTILPKESPFSRILEGHPSCGKAKEEEEEESTWSSNNQLQQKRHLQPPAQAETPWLALARALSFSTPMYSSLPLLLPHPFPLLSFFSWLESNGCSILFRVLTVIVLLVATIVFYFFFPVVSTTLLFCFSFSFFFSLSFALLLFSPLAIIIDFINCLKLNLFLI